MDFTFRDYQATKVDAALRHLEAGRSVLNEGPTGEGKTFQGVAVLALAVGKLATHAIVIAPQEQIEEGFRAHNGSMILWPVEMNRSQPIRIPHDFVRAARAGRSGSVKEILDYLATPNPGYVLATTHASMTTLFGNRLAEFPACLDGCLLFVDEAHRAGARVLSVVTREWRARGGLQISATATPWRSDGVNPFAEDVARLRRTMPEHMAEGFAPKEVAHEIVAFGDLGERVTSREFTGRTVASRYCRSVAEAMAARWVAKGKPKTIIRIPPRSGGSKALVAHLTKLLRKEGARVLDSTGVGSEHKKRFVDALAAERGRSWLESQIDVVIGCMRVMEGTDWAVCSHVFCLGIPGSVGSVAQLLGRAMRQKAADHPSAERAEITFFVPCADRNALKNLSLEHSRRALLLAAFLADFKVGEEWAMIRAIRKGLGIKPGDDLAIAVDDALWIDPAIAAEAKLHLADAVTRVPDATIGDLIDWICLCMPQASRNDVVGVVLRAKAAEETPEGERVRGAIAERFAASSQIGAGIAANRLKVFDEVLESFRDETLKNSESVNSMAAQMHVLTAGDIQGFTRRLVEANAGVGNLTLNQVLRKIHEHWKRTGEYPNRESGPIPGTNCTWAMAETSLLFTLRGLPYHASLGHLIAVAFIEAEEDGRGDLCADQLRAWIKAWWERCGETPNRDSGWLPETHLETWASIDLALRLENRCLVGYLDLQDFIFRECAFTQTKAARSHALGVQRRELIKALAG